LIVHESNFKKEIETNEDYKPERVFFACRNQIPMATGSAWFRKEFGYTAGYLHMVGALSCCSGKGLGLQASLAALHRMAEEGRKSAILHTDDFRIPAIITYLKLGFKPKLTHESHPDRWKKLLMDLARQDLLMELTAGISE
jgi:mycothiol synthase